MSSSGSSRPAPASVDASLRSRGEIVLEFIILLTSPWLGYWFIADAEGFWHYWGIVVLVFWVLRLPSSYVRFEAGWRTRMPWENER